jgi:hypothetical protein
MISLPPRRIPVFNRSWYKKLMGSDDIWLGAASPTLPALGWRMPGMRWGGLSPSLHGASPRVLCGIPYWETLHDWRAGIPAPKGFDRCCAADGAAEFLTTPPAANLPSATWIKPCLDIPPVEVVDVVPVSPLAHCVADIPPLKLWMLCRFLPWRTALRVYPPVDNVDVVDVVDVSSPVRCRRGTPWR